MWVLIIPFLLVSIFMFIHDASLALFPPSSCRNIFVNQTAADTFWLVSRLMSVDVWIWPIIIVFWRPPSRYRLLSMNSEGFALKKLDIV